jgi:hypothetical protein
MGYYVNIVESTAKIPAANLQKAYENMCLLNITHDHVKRGCCRSGGKQTEKFFSWMDENYPETCEDAQAVLEQLGFETEYNKDGDLLITGYDNKTGQEDLFLESITYLTEGTIEWEGEDGDTWTTEFQGEGIIEGTVEREALPAPVNLMLQ